MSAQDLIARVKAAAAAAPETLPDSTPLAYRHISFEYVDAHGTRGCMRIVNTRPRLLAFAEQVRKNAAAFDGKLPRRKPAGARKPAAASPISTARALLSEGSTLEALAAIEARGGEVFFGAAPVPVLHQVSQRVEREGRRWLVTRCAVDGLIYLIHEASGLSANGDQKFGSVADALARLDVIHRDEAENGYRQKMIAAIERAAAYDQQAARAAFEAIDGITDKRERASTAQAAFATVRALAAAQQADPADEAPAAAQAEAPAPAVESVPPAACPPAVEIDPPSVEIEAAAPSDGMGERFTIDLGSYFGVVPYRATAPTPPRPGCSVLSSQILVRKVTLTKRDANNYGLPDVIHAWRISVLSSSVDSEPWARVEAMTADYGRTAGGEIRAYFECVTGHALDALERMAPAISKAARAAWEEVRREKPRALDIASPAMEIQNAGAPPPAVSVAPAAPPVVESEDAEEQALRRGDFEECMRLQEERQQREIAAVGDVSGGGILRHGGGSRWVFLLPDVSGGDAWRMQRFDACGFSGHDVFSNMARAVDAAIGEGFKTRDDGALDRMQETAAFQRGNYAADLIRRINCGELDHAAFHALMAEYDAAQAPPAAELETPAAAQAPCAAHPLVAILEGPAALRVIALAWLALSIGRSTHESASARRGRFAGAAWAPRVGQAARQPKPRPGMQGHAPAWMRERPARRPAGGRAGMGGNAQAPPRRLFPPTPFRAFYKPTAGRAGSLLEST